MANTAARRFSPIFTASVTLGSVRTGTASNGNKYSVVQGSTVHGEKVRNNVTVMAFGKQRDEVAKVLRKGKTVDLAVQWDQGSLKVIGLPRAKAA
jgi:hypothetical protein